MRYPKFKEGDFLKIPLEDGLHGYARRTRDLNLAIYDVVTEEDMSLDAVAKLPVLYIRPVTSYLIKRGRWPVIGNAPVKEELNAFQRVYTHGVDGLGIFEGNSFDSLRPATPEECLSLEEWSVPDPEHIEMHLLDRHYRRPNISKVYDRFRLFYHQDQWVPLNNVQGANEWEKLEWVINHFPKLKALGPPSTFN